MSTGQTQKSYFFGILIGILIGIFLTLGYQAMMDEPSEGGAAGKETAEKTERLPDGITLLDEPVPFTEAKNFKIRQVVFEDAALAQSKKKMQYTGSNYFTDPIVLIITDQKNTFYDDQIVKCPKDSKVMQVATYQYQTQMGWKTVPVVRFVKP